VSRCRFCGNFFPAKPTSTHTYCKKAIRVSRCRFGGINISIANFTSMKKKSCKTYIYSLLLHHEFNLIFSHTACGFLIPPSYSEVSIGDTREHPLDVYLEMNHCISISLKLNAICEKCFIIGVKLVGEIFIPRHNFFT